MRLSVLLPTKDGASRLPETLASVASQRVEGEVEVVVVDDGSRDGTAAVLAAARLPWGPPRVVSHPSPRGRAAARNSAAAAARGEVLVLLDDDMTLLPGALAAHRAFHLAHPDAAARARVTLATPERPSAFARFAVREEREQEAVMLARRDDLPFALCATGHLSLPREVLRRVGGFDASVDRYGFEDVDLGYRLWRAGVKLHYEPAAASIHRAYATDLDRYLARHLEAGAVARQLAERHPRGPFRAYLRVDPPERLGLGEDPAGLVALRLANRWLLRAPVRRALGSTIGFAALLRMLRAGEALKLDRAVQFGYQVARDVRYFQGYFGER